MDDYDAVMDINAKLPKYLGQGLTEEKLAQLRTKQLKAAYLDVLDAKNDRELQKALKNAAYEKARYYAHRIADTEEHRAFTLANGQKMLNDGVELVKISLSSAHKIFCVCDYHTSLNSGYGKGIYRINEAPMPPYHPHCRCKMTPVYRDKKYRPMPDGYSPLEEYSQKQKDKLDQAFRSKWKTPKLGDVL